MSEHKEDHHEKEHIYFDDTLEVLAPVVVVLLLAVIFGLVFFG
jgi:uncharacterized membrane protein (DUF106 family)